MYHEIFFSFLPQLNTVKTIWWDGYSPRGIICQLWVPSLGWGFTVHITRFCENALLLQQWGGCEVNGLASVLILLDLLARVTHLSSLYLKYFLHLPSGILDLPVFLLHLPHSCSVLLSHLPSSNRFRSTRMALCLALQYFSTLLSYQLIHSVISASLKALRTVYTLPNYIISPGFSRRIPSHIPMVSIFVSPKYKCWNLNPQRWWF